MYLIDVINKKLALHRLIRLRHRHIFTKSNRLRLRYVVCMASVLALSATGFLGTMNSSIAFVPKEIARDVTPQSNVILASAPSKGQDVSDDTNQSMSKADERQLKAEMAVEPLLNVDVVVDEETGLPYETVILSEELPSFQDIDDLSKVAVVLPVETPVDAAAINTLPRDEILEIKTGDTVAGALQAAGISGAEAYRVVKAMSKHYDPRSVKPGQAISVHIEPAGDGIALSSLEMKIDATKELVVVKDEHDRFQPEVKKKKVIKTLKAAKATIQTSLYGSAARAGIPASVIADMIRVYSYEVDFQRDIRQGDSVEILYETYETEDGDFARYGNILYANLAVSGDKIPIYRFKQKDGDIDYYRENGMNLKSTLMQTPIDGARMSSGYGMRKHPVLGYNKMHKGIDFAASRGTPIYAAGDGTIEKAGRAGGYGNYVRIRHNSELSTAYAHMQKFAKNIRAGKRVKQGQVIGYVGTTGRSTGPHLHFEVLKYGKQINPKKVKTASREKLKGTKLKNFKAQVSQIKQKFATLEQELKFAKNDAQ